MFSLSSRRLVIVKQSFTCSGSRFDRQVQCLTSFMKTIAASQSAIDSFQTSALLLQTRVGIRQQRDKELARPIKNRLKICIACLKQF